MNSPARGGEPCGASELSDRLQKLVPGSAGGFDAGRLDGLAPQCLESLGDISIVEVPQCAVEVTVSKAS